MKRRTNFHIQISARIPREDYRDLRKLRQRNEVTSDTVRRLLHESITLAKQAENTPEISDSPVKETAQ